MHPERLRIVGWWGTRFALPIALLAVTAVLLGRSDSDRASLEPFFDTASQTFPLRHDWFFDGVLHIGGRSVVAASTVLLVLAAALGWRSPRFGAHAKRCAYLAACVLLTVAIAGGWKKLAMQVTPWNTIGFGGQKPWQGGASDATWSEMLGSPGAHASAGFAWVALFFVGLSLDTRNRWLWLAPGALLGLIFAVGQHVRGAHQPSHELWSIVIAWGAAGSLAFLFRRLGWLSWSEFDVPAADDLRLEAQPDRAIPWLVGPSMALLGAAFFGIDRGSGRLELRYSELHHAVEIVEFIGMCVGLGVAAWLLTDKIATLRARAAQRLEEERERKFHLLGRMAASVAHEVRNPLHTLRLIVDEQRFELPALREHPLRAELDACVERIDRAVKLVYRLARPEHGEIGDVELTNAVQEALTALERLNHGRVRFAWLQPPQRALVRASRDAVGIVLDNVLRNAAEAAPQGSEVRLGLESNGATWSLRIQNEGSLTERVPKPAHEQGLGLGFAISKQLVTGAGGNIDLTEDHGIVECVLRLPRVPEPSA